MKLAAKLVSIFILGAMLLVGINGYFTVRREVELFEQDIRTDTRRLGSKIRDIVSDVVSVTGQGRAIQLVEVVEGQPQERMRIRWVWLNAPPGSPYQPKVPRDKLGGFAQGEESYVKMRGQDGPGYHYTYYPIPVKGGQIGGLEISESLELLDECTRSTVVRTGVLMLGMVVLSGVLMAGFGVRMVGSPLKQLTEKTRRVGAGDLTGPIHLGGNDELSELARSLNAMCDQLATSQEELRTETGNRIAALDQLRHADRLKTVGRLASGIAHELGTPLNVVSGRAGLIASGKLPDDEIVLSARTIKEETDRISTIIRNLLNFARRSTPQRTSIDLGQVARKTVELLDALAEKRNCSLSLKCVDVPQMAMVDAGQIQQVLSNLIVNALQAMPNGGTVHIEVDAAHARPPEGSGQAEGDYFQISVSDEADGIPEETLPHLFEPFFTTKDVGEGTGLGLSIAYGIVQDHGGWISVTSEPGKGSCFTVFLPQEVQTCADAS